MVAVCGEWSVVEGRRAEVDALRECAKSRTSDEDDIRLTCLLTTLHIYALHLHPTPQSFTYFGYLLHYLSLIYRLKYVISNVCISFN